MRIGRNGNNRHIGPFGANDLSGFETIHHRHTNIHQNQVYLRVFLSQLNRYFPVFGTQNVQTQTAEKLFYQEVIEIFVFGYKNGSRLKEGEFANRCFQLLNLRNRRHAERNRYLKERSLAGR